MKTYPNLIGAALVSEFQKKANLSDEQVDMIYEFLWDFKKKYKDQVFQDTIESRKKIESQDISFNQGAYYAYSDFMDFISSLKKDADK